jgi:hypothetical protein
LLSFLHSSLVISSNVYESEYQSVLDRATALGYTLPSSGQRTKQNQLLRDLKSAGIWNSLDVFYIFATDGSSDFATLNWKAPSSFQITKVNSPTFTANEGFDFDGTTQYLNTNWIPGTNGVNYTQNNAGIGFYVNDNVASNTRADIGASNNADGLTNSIFINVRNATDTLAYTINDNNTGTVGITDSRGFHHIKRTASNARALYKNGVSIQTSSQVSVSLVTVAIYIGASNGNGTATRFSPREISMFFAGSSLNGLESSFYTAWNNYFTSL